MKLTLIALALLISALPARAEDREYIRGVEDAQRARPAQLSSTARIAPESEPGTVLVVHGRAYATDGKTPLEGAIVFAYHTDREGLYNPRGSKPHTWRLKGWAKTGADGKFEFRTIRPGSYPGGKNAAHIHFAIFTADGARYHAGGALFDDDKLVGKAEREATRLDPVFGSVRPVRREGSVEHIDLNLRIAAGDKF